MNSKPCHKQRRKMKNNMRYVPLFLIIVAAVCSGALDSPDRYTPLKMYEGSWNMTKTKPMGKRADRLVDDCALIGRYFACQQTINGEPKDLFIIIPRRESGRYYTQGVNSEGLAYGRTDLLIEGNTWTYSNKSSRDGKPMFYKTVNVFSGTDHIHFEQLESADGAHWTVLEAGDEVRVGVTK